MTTRLKAPDGPGALATAQKLNYLIIIAPDGPLRAIPNIPYYQRSYDGRKLAYILPLYLVTTSCDHDF
jgi:hypothetical protein